ncbi:MAG: lamin tail domain-containing protein, partial [Candidatus Thermoplasmatota archaeon]|nr:lamin tail domain-containing protein [Candidatus Thermoplasmatota archaeon]
GAGFADRLFMTEIMIDPDSGGPEWIELHNRDQFAVNLSGWSVSRITNDVVSAHELITIGVVPGESYLLLSGNPSIQDDLGAALIIDMGISGVLGSGQINSLDSSGGQILFQYAEYNSALTYDLIDFNWDSTWNINNGYSLVWNNYEFSNSSNWIPLEDGTPGSI